jgi:hypothetical protein
MKKYITLLICVANIINIYSQEGVEVPLNTPIFDIQSGTYQKDLDNRLNPYTGAWEGTWQGKKFTLVIDKIIKKLHTSESGFYYYEDILIGRYKITNLSDGVIIENNLNEQNLDLIKIENTSTGKSSKLYLIYLDKDLCSNTGQILLKGNPSSNQLIYTFNYGEFWMKEDCPYLNKSDIPVPIPTVSLTLTRL